MNYCLYCHSLIEQKVSWRNFFGINSEDLLCFTCHSKLERIGEEKCVRCGRSFIDLDPMYRNDNQCIDCVKWERDEEWRGVLEQNRSIYQYNEALKNIIYKFKYRGDAELAKIFGKPLKRIYDKYFTSHIIVPIPLSKERLYERGFNQAERIACHLGEPIYALSRMTHEDKQSKKSRADRLKSQDTPAFVTENSLKKYIENYDIIIIDDIYTTGATVRHAAKALKLAGAKSISSITVAR